MFFSIDDPASRLYHWNLIAALAMILFWAVSIMGPKEGLKSITHFVFDFRYWWNKSTRRDYLIASLNALFKVFLFIPFLDFSFHIARFVSRTMVEFSGDFLGLAPSVWAIAFFTVGSFVWDDFLRFFHHYLAHNNSFLWRLHSVHHSAKVLTPVTLYRIHPLESAIATLRNSLSIGVSTGVFIYLFESQLSVWTIFGVSALGFLFNFLGGNLRHSHIPIRFFPWLEKVFISPLQHQIHHSSHAHHRDKNFGVTLSVWDLIFGSWVGSHSLEKTGPSTLKFGLGNRQTRSILKELGLPEIDLGKPQWRFAPLTLLACVLLFKL